MDYQLDTSLVELQLKSPDEERVFTDIKKMILGLSNPYERGGRYYSLWSYKREQYDMICRINDDLKIIQVLKFVNMGRSK